MDLLEAIIGLIICMAFLAWRGVITRGLLDKHRVNDFYRDHPRLKKFIDYWWQKP